MNLDGENHHKDSNIFPMQEFLWSFNPGSQIAREGERDSVVR